MNFIHDTTFCTWLYLTQSAYRMLFLCSQDSGWDMFPILLKTGQQRSITMLSLWYWNKIFVALQITLGSNILVFFLSFCIYGSILDIVRDNETVLWALLTLLNINKLNITNIALRGTIKQGNFYVCVLRNFVWWVLWSIICVMGTGIVNAMECALDGKRNDRKNYVYMLSLAGNGPTHSPIFLIIINIYINLFVHFRVCLPIPFSIVAKCNLFIISFVQFTYIPF